MILNDRIDNALKKEESKSFLLEHIDVIRGNILDCEKRISRKIVLVVSFITLAELINRGIVTKISFFATEVDDLKLVLLIMPCIIAYYCYSLINQVVLRRLLNDIYSKIIKSKYPIISEYDLEFYLTTYLSTNTEDILTSGNRNWVKTLIDITSAPFILIFQYLPIPYCFYLLMNMFNNDFYTCSSVWFSLAITSLLFIRGILLIISTIKENGGIVDMAKELISNFKKNSTTNL